MAVAIDIKYAIFATIATAIPWSVASQVLADIVVVDGATAFFALFYIKI